MKYIFEISYFISFFIGVIFFVFIMSEKLFLLLPIVLIFFIVQLYLMLRMHWFVKTMRRLIDALNEGEFNVDLTGVGNDVMGKLVAYMLGALKKTGEFEKLRQARVLLYYRALSLILRHIDKPVIWIDIERDIFRLNPSCQKLFGVEQDEYKLSGILRLADNEVFASWFNKLISNSDIVPNEIACEVALPVSRRAHMFYVSSLVVKTGEDKAQIVFLFLREA